MYPKTLYLHGDVSASSIRIESQEMHKIYRESGILDNFKEVENSAQSEQEQQDEPVRRGPGRPPRQKQDDSQ